jgi:hypothetical protein
MTCTELELLRQVGQRWYEKMRQVTKPLDLGPSDTYFAIRVIDDLNAVLNDFEKEITKES